MTEPHSRRAILCHSLRGVAGLRGLVLVARGGLQAGLRGRVGVPADKVYDVLSQNSLSNGIVSLGEGHIFPQLPLCSLVSTNRRNASGGNKVSSALARLISSRISDALSDPAHRPSHLGIGRPQAESVAASARKLYPGLDELRPVEADAA